MLCAARQLCGTKPTLESNGAMTAISNCAYAIVPGVVLEFRQALQLQHRSNVVGKPPLRAFCRAHVPKSKHAISKDVSLTNFWQKCCLTISVAPHLGIEEKFVSCENENRSSPL